MGFPPAPQSSPWTMLQVICPAGVAAGGQLGVNTPAGMVVVTVPAGIGPGMAFHIQMPSTGMAPPPAPMSVPASRPPPAPPKPRELTLANDPAFLAIPETPPEKLEVSFEATSSIRTDEGLTLDRVATGNRTKLV